MNFGKMLKSKREEVGISIYRLSKLSGVSKILLSAYEKGSVIPSIEKANKICVALGWELILGKEDP